MAQVLIGNLPENVIAMCCFACEDRSDEADRLIAAATDLVPR